MGKFLLHILLIFSVLLSFDCSKLMSLGYECPRIEHGSNVKTHPPCHHHKPSGESKQKGGCNCEKKQPTVLKSRFETFKPVFIVLNFVLLNDFSTSFRLESNIFYDHTYCRTISLPKYHIPITTIHLLI
ncbi:MAG: hypothetical protein H7A23_22305 [Leptospiraceae bacterium]|nr:hypothetical protein [Leptospiraceae bacterium]MCP5497295.1 hypothetical protein [Leptospiraceae bacterium]